MSRTKTCLVLSVVVVSACGGGGSSGSLDVDDLSSRVATVMCGQLNDCCTPDEFREETLGSADEAQCIQRYGGLFEGLLAGALRDSIAAGRVVYHADRAGACLDGYAAMSCLEFIRAREADGPFEGCSDPFEGTVAIAGACTDDMDCISNYCSGDTLDMNGNRLMGTCATPPAAGQPCDQFECGEGTYCQTGGQTPVCREPQADGAPCFDGDECASSGCNGAGTSTPGTCGQPMTCDGL
jgi:hypothetical protein